MPILQSQDVVMIVILRLYSVQILASPFKIATKNQFQQTLEMQKFLILTITKKECNFNTFDQIQSPKNSTLFRFSSLYF